MISSDISRTRIDNGLLQENRTNYVLHSKKKTKRKMLKIDLNPALVVIVDYYLCYTISYYSGKYFLYIFGTAYFNSSIIITEIECFVD